MALSVFIDEIPTKTDNLSGNELFLLEDGNTRTVLLSTVSLFSKTFTKGVSKFTIDIGDGSNNVFNVLHNLGTRDVITSVYSASNYLVLSGFRIFNTDTNTVTLSFDGVPTQDSIKVVVMG